MWPPLDPMDCHWPPLSKETSQSKLYVPFLIRASLSNAEPLITIPVALTELPERVTALFWVETTVPLYLTRIRASMLRAGEGVIVNFVKTVGFVVCESVSFLYATGLLLLLLPPRTQVGVEPSGLSTYSSGVTGNLLIV